MNVETLDVNAEIWGGVSVERFTQIHVYVLNTSLCVDLLLLWGC